MRMERQEASQGFNLALSSSGPKYTFDASKLLDAASSDPMHRLDMGVSASLGFGDPLGSSLVLSLSSATDFSALPSVSAGLGYTQPVSGLLGWRPKDAQATEEQFTLEKAQIGVFLQKIAVKKGVLAELKQVVNGRLKIMDNERRTADVRESIEKAKMLGTYRAGSYQAQSSDFSVEALDEERTQYQDELSYTLSRLSARTGGATFVFPDAIPSVQLLAPDAEEHGRNPQVYMLNQDLAVARMRRSELDYSGYPDISVSTSLSFDSLSLATSLSLSWKIFDNGVLKLSKADQDLGIEILQLSVEEAIASFRHSVVGIETAISGIESRGNSLAREEALLVLEGQQNRDQYQKGIITEVQYNRQSADLVYRQTRLDLQKTVLRLDAYGVFLDGQTLVAPILPLIR